MPSQPVSGSAGIADVADSFVLNTGIETNSYLDTQLKNGVYHIINDVGNTIDVEYNFNIGIDGAPV